MSESFQIDDRSLASIVENMGEGKLESVCGTIASILVRATTGSSTLAVLVKKGASEIVARILAKSSYTVMQNELTKLAAEEEEHQSKEVFADKMREILKVHIESLVGELEAGNQNRFEETIRKVIGDQDKENENDLARLSVIFTNAGIVGIGGSGGPGVVGHGGPGGPGVVGHGGPGGPGVVGHGGRGVSKKRNQD